MSIVKIDEEVLILPSIDENDEGIQLDMRPIAIALARQEDVACVTKERAPELMALFLTSYSLTRKYLVMANARLSQAKIYQRRMHAILARDKVPDWIKERGLKDTERNVNMLIDLVPEYQAVEDKVHMLECFVEMFEAQAKTLEQAYTATKKIFSVYQPNVFGIEYDKLETGKLEESPDPNFKIGKAKYRF